MTATNAIGFTKAKRRRRRDVTTIEKIFSPEFRNRLDEVVKLRFS